MNYLLDTCVISELHKPEPDAGVVRWLENADETALYLSVLTLGELEKGIAGLPASARRRKLEAWVRKDLAERFRGRLLDVNADVAAKWGALSGDSESRGMPLPVIDALLAATSLVHDLTVATRNTTDFERCGAGCVNPWRGQA